MARYDVNNIAVSSLLSSIKDGSIAIPEIQRPFVWDSTKVRDLIDSLYQNYPVGYIIVWQNLDVKLKDGTISSGKKVLIDGQQRITALAAAIVGQEVVGADYKKFPIKIAFNPQEERFDVVNPAILKDTKYIPDIAAIFDPGFNSFGFVIDYCQKNGITDSEGMSKISDIIHDVRLHGLVLPNQLNSCVHLHVEPADDLTHEISHGHFRHIVWRRFIDLGGPPQPVKDGALPLRCGNVDCDTAKSSVISLPVTRHPPRQTFGVSPANRPWHPRLRSWGLAVVRGPSRPGCICG